MRGQNKRMRGRSGGGGGGNRKQPNPLTRSYESNGPDVKVRGTAAHVAEKYQQLARDAQASGDRIASENYLQHAEHYLRIIASAQAQIQSAQQEAGNDHSGRRENDQRAGRRDSGSESDERAGTEPQPARGSEDRDSDDNESGDMGLPAFLRNATRVAGDDNAQAESPDGGEEDRGGRPSGNRRRRRNTKPDGESQGEGADGEPVRAEAAPVAEVADNA